MHVAFIQTGGTIDKDYPVQLKAYGFVIQSAAFNCVLSKLRKAFTTESSTVCKKDSQEITEEDRAALLCEISSTPASKVIVTHGTDTMIETAQYIQKRATGSDMISKTVVFTGAIKPQKIIDSDADFNIGCSVGALNLLNPGVYICMNGRIIECHLCHRNLDTGLFQRSK